MKRKIMTILTATVLTMGIFAGCSTNEPAENPVENEVVQTPVEEEEETPEAEEVVEVETVYPLTIQDSNGNEVTLDKKPERIIAVSPTITESMFALNAQDLLVGRTDYCDYPEEVSEIESIGSLQEPNIEKIVELQPDIVVASAHFSEDVYEKLNELDVKVIVLNPNDSFEGVYSTLETLGEAVNENLKVTELVNEMKAKVDEVEEKVSGLPTPSVYYVVGFGEFGDYTAGGGTFISEMINRVNGNNIADDVEGWSYSLEKVVEHDPEMVIISKYFDAKSGFVAANGYMDLTAVKDDKVFEIDNNLIDRQGPRLAQGFEELAKIIHPDAFK